MVQNECLLILVFDKGVIMPSGRKHPKFENITSRWGGMKIRREFANRIENWLQAFPEEEHALLLDLLLQFYYYSEERVNENVVKLFDNFMKQYQGNIEDIIYTKIIKEQGVACSDVLFTTFWLKNNIKSNAENNIIGLLEEEQVPMNLVIVDDYSGTGKTLIKTIDKMLQVNDKIQYTNLYFLTLHITKRAIQQIEEYAKSIGMNIWIISLDCSDEIFKKNYIYDEIEAEQKKQYYSEICRKHKVEKHVLGFEDVSSLVAFHYNTPNNTLGLFWQDLMNFAALFPRIKMRKTELAKMQKEAKNRKKRDEVPIVYGIEDGKMAVLLTYCLSQSGDISVENFKNAFGFTALQADEALKEMLEQGYIINDAGRFRPTAKLKSCAFMSRMKKGQSRFQEQQETKVEFQLHEEYIPGNFE